MRARQVGRTQWCILRDAPVPAGTSGCTVRSFIRHRDSLVPMASTHLQHMQKALDQMNLQLRHVSDRGGHFWRVSATRIRWLHSAIGGSRPSAYN